VIHQVLVVLHDRPRQLLETFPESLRLEGVFHPNDGWTPARRKGLRRCHVQHGHDFPPQFGGSLPVRLVDHEDVGDLHNARLDGLDLVAHPRNQDHDDRMGMVDDVHFLLTGPDGFHDNYILAHDIQDMDGITHSLGQSAQGTAGGQGTNENPRILRMALHTDPVAQNGAAGERTRRIHRQDAHGFLLLPEGLHQTVHQCGLTRPRRTRDADDMGLTGQGKDVFDRGSRFIDTVFQVAYKAGGRSYVSTSNFLNFFHDFKPLVAHSFGTIPRYYPGLPREPRWPSGRRHRASENPARE